MIEEILNQWYGSLADLTIALDGNDGGLCHECLDPQLRTAAHILDTDPHAAVHPLIVALRQFVREYDEDAADVLEYTGVLGAELVTLELLMTNDFVRRVLDVQVVPRVDAFVSESSAFLDGE